MEESDFTGIVKNGGHYVPRINRPVGLPDESRYVIFRNEYSLLHLTFVLNEVKQKQTFYQKLASLFLTHCHTYPLFVTSKSLRNPGNRSEIVFEIGTLLKQVLNLLTCIVGKVQILL